MTDDSKNEDKKLYGVSMADYGRWDQAHPPTVVTGEFRVDFRPDLLHCEVCGAPAEYVHFTSAGGSSSVGFMPDHGDTAVKFACSKHDLEGYPVDFERLFDPNEGFLTHIAEKTWGLYAMAMLDERLEEIAREAMLAEGVLK
jgi:hypothetical protein